MQHDIGCEMPQHGTFQPIFPVQPAAADSDQAVENNCTRDDQKVHRQADRCRGRQVTQTKEHSCQDVGNPEERQPAIFDPFS